MSAIPGPVRVSRWDVAIAVGIAVIQLVGGRGANLANGQQTLDALGYVLLLIGPVALVLRRRYPLPVFMVTLLAAAGYTALGFGYGPIFLSLIIGFLTAATTRPRRYTYPVVPVGYLLLVWPLPDVLGHPTNWWQIFGVAAWLAMLLSIAEGLRQREAVLEARRQRAEAAERNELAEHERVEAQRERRATEERLAIARELHDVLAHSLSVINVQSSVALELFEKKPEQAATALAAIKTASRDALGEVHALLHSIRAGTGPVTAPTAPVAGLADLDRVVAGARAAGLEVRTEITGAGRRLPSVVDVAAARIIRESLTNVLRHAPGAAAVVCVRYAPEHLRITVDNTAPQRVTSHADGGTGGTGIAGMMERAAALGGEVVAGPRPDSGFRVDARLPVTYVQEESR
ncbi:histidine kinase [Nocardia sp. NPDC004568]|uniref:sensor histidine kinase n=1 Tax=Nocardia sp. NPDC004568 TaxID=3154551 RepID=UPI0033AB8E9A